MAQQAMSFVAEITFTGNRGDIDDAGGIAPGGFTLLATGPHHSVPSQTESGLVSSWHEQVQRHPPS